MAYVDGFVIPCRRTTIDKYKSPPGWAAKVWMEHGALVYVECIGEDVPYGELTSFPRAVQAKDDEVVVSPGSPTTTAQARDEIMAEVMADEALKGPDQMAVRRQAHDLRRLPELRGGQRGWPTSAGQADSVQTAPLRRRAALPRFILARRDGAGDIGAVGPRSRGVVLGARV